MENQNSFRTIEIEDLNTVTGGADDPKPVGGDGSSIARHDSPFQPLEDGLKGKTIGEG